MAQTPEWLNQGNEGEAYMSDNSPVIGLDMRKKEMF